MAGPDSTGADRVGRALSPRFTAAGGLVRPLQYGAATALVLSVGSLALLPVIDDGLSGPLGAYAWLLAVVLVAIARATRLRRDVAEARAGADRPPDDGVTAGPAESPWEARLAWFGREGVAVGLSLGGATGLAAVWVAFRSGLTAQPFGPIGTLAGLALGGLAFLLLLASRTCRAIPVERLPEGPALTEWLRGAQWITLVTAIELLAREMPGLSPAWERGVTLALQAGVALCAVELWARGFGQGFRRRRDWQEVEVPIRSTILAVLFHGRGPLRGVLDLVEDRLGLSLESAWAIGVIRRNLGILAAGLALVLWGSTALVAIRPEEQGLRLHWGRLVSQVPLEPGLRVTWPWPVETVERYPVRRTQTLGLGYTGRPKDALLWGRIHAGEEYQLLLGDGRELVSIDATVTYRIRDVRAFALSFQNPVDALDAVAYRLLLRETVATSLDRVLTADRGPFERRFAVTLQQACDEEQLGLEILHVGFVSLHPPVDVAGAYEDVVSAQIEQETRAARARADREAALPAAQSAATRDVQTADGEAAQRLADARGGAVGFLAARRADGASSALFRWRRRFEAMEEALANRTLVVVDHRLGTAPGTLWIDLRSRTDTPTTEKR